jgi:hypothetical protein
MTMEPVIRPAQAPPQGEGYRVPPTREINTAVPAITIGDGPNPIDPGPVVRTDQANDMGFYPLLRANLVGGHEAVTPWISVAGSYEIDPNACGVWRLRCLTSSLTLTFAALTALPVTSGIFATMRRMVTLSVIIDWQAAASGSRTLTLSGVKFEGGTAPDWSTDSGKIDSLVLQITSDGDKFGYPAGIGLA